MNWYLAKIIYQVIVGDGIHHPQFDAQFRLIRADEFNWAIEKSQTLGRLGETIFRNHKEEQVRWKFIAVEDVFPIEDITDGAELYSQTEEPADVEEYIQLANAKSKRLNY